MTILEAAAALRAKKASAVELTTECLARIKKSSLNAFITVLEDAARSRASAMDAERAHGVDRGPFHGVPIAHKDLVLIKGVRTTAGSKIFADFVPDYDAAVAEKLEQAGAVLIGKTGMHELAYGITSNNPHFGAIHNPWNPECIPGGSSGGSAAAVAANLVPMALGSDTGGSIRIPASFCGCAGLKPTYGRVSRYGVLPLGFSLDHMGPLARTVRDAALTLKVIAGYDPRDDSTRRRPVPDYLQIAPIRGLRIGLPENFYFDRLDPEVASSVRSAVETAGALGARVIPLRVPDIDALNTVGRVLLLAEATTALRPHLHRRDDLGADLLALVDEGQLIFACDYLDAQRLRRLFIRDFDKLWQQVDCLMTPTTPTAAPKIGQTTMQVGPVTEDVRLATTRLVRGINVLGVPALSLPCGLTNAGLPIGLQILAPPWREETLIRAGAALEEAINFEGLL